MLQKSAAFSSLLGGAYALTMRQAGCSFHLNTDGALSSPVGQFDSGQARASPNESPSSFTLNGNALTDAKGRGCWWTPPATVLQCDVGQTPEPGFGIGCDGTVSYNGQTTFYECQTGADNITMIYLSPKGTQCGEIKLHADGCYPSNCGGQGTATGGVPSYPTGGGESVPPGTSPAGTPPAGTPPAGTPPAGTPPASSPGTTAPGEGGSTSPGQYPTGTPSVSTSNEVSPTPSTSTSPGGAGSTTQPGQYPGTTPNGASSTPSASTPTEGASSSTPRGYPVGTPSPSTSNSAGSTTTPGQYPGTTLSTTITTTTTTTSNGAGSTTPGQYPGTTPSSRSTPNGADSSSTPGQYPTGTSSSPASTASTPGQTGTPGGSCPGELKDGAYEFPHLIIPVDSSKADAAQGTSYFGEVTQSISSAFNFDIPQADAGKTCSLVFYFPTQGQLETSSYTFSGSGAVEFARLGGAVSEGTTYSNLPAVAESYGQQTVAPGNAYTVKSFACPAGQSVSFSLKAAGGDGSTSLRYFQDYNPCPIGLYITVS